MSVHEEQVLKQRGIKHDVAVVRNEEVALRRIETFEPFARERRDAAGNNLFVDGFHHLTLKLPDRANLHDPFPNRLELLVREDIGCQQRKELTRSNTLHRCRDLVVTIGTDIVKCGFFRGTHGCLRLSMNLIGLRLLAG